ncbi:Edrf1 [Symbiodinium natans]|uniref:Edrf1 protein n=1 Tax=Symbiodinium natans TaxID=878477 RepID=A0A812P202_9DINO|nr:Edrf1 [Symbiodinium natans]
MVSLKSAMAARDQSDITDFASFKLMAPNVSQPSKDERLDVYLENTMCDITKVVWGCPQGEAMTWSVHNTADLPQSSGDAERFDPDRLREHGQQLLHFLRQRCRREGGTYWLFREQNSSRAELFDISNSGEREDEDGNWETSAAFRTTPSLATPIASLCFHLAKSMEQESDQRQLLQKATHLLEPLKEDQYGLYATAALQLACSYMRTPVAALADQAASVTTPPGEAPPAARLSVAMRYLEKVLRLLGRLSDDASTLRAGLLLQGQVAYAECIVKLVKEACIPTYSAWLTQVQRSSQEIIQKHGASSAAAQKQPGPSALGVFGFGVGWLGVLGGGAQDTKEGSVDMTIADFVAHVNSIFGSSMDCALAEIPLGFYSAIIMGRLVDLDVAVCAPSWATAFVSHLPTSEHFRVPPKHVAPTLLFRRALSVLYF